MNFKDCHIIPQILTALEEQGYTEPTAIQAGAIPPALEGRDVLGCARTGTGKTCAFAVPILQRLNASPNGAHPIRALVLTPTRELAIQNQDCFAAYGKNLPLRSVVIFGGVGQRPQELAIRKGADILVATPGRLGDLYQQGLLDFSKLEVLVLDEADRMLDMGFWHDVKRILAWLPEKKQTLFFSATLPKEITALVNSLLHDPVKIAVDPVNTTVDAIRQQLYRVDRGNKTKLLVHLLAEQEIPSALVFTRTKHGANKVSRELEKEGISSAAIHGNKSQSARQQALAGFKDGSIRVLVATDLAARGLDIEGMPCVINYNLPDVPETYVHRIGRTGRAGQSGIAITLCDIDEAPLLKEVQKFIKNPIPEIKGHLYPMQVFEVTARDKHGKPINPEIQEARAAAREAKRLWNEERIHAKKQAAEQNALRPEAQEEAAGEKTPKKGKKAKKAPVKHATVSRPEPESLGGIVPIPDLLPKREELPAEPDRPFDSNDILNRKRRKPERKVIPSLSSVSLQPMIDLKEPLVSRLRTDDGTDDIGERLSAQNNRTTRQTNRKRNPAKPVAAAPKAEPEKQKKPRPARKKTAQTGETVVKQEQKKSRTKPAAKGQELHSSVQNPVQKVQKSVDRAQAQPGRPAQKTRVPRRPDSGMRYSNQKDSTEQTSLMKPYYLSDRRKG